MRIDTLEKIFREAFAIRFFRPVEAEKFWSVNGETGRGRSMTVGYGHEQRLVVLPVVSDLQEDRIRLPARQRDVAVVSKYALCPSFSILFQSDTSICEPVLHHFRRITGELSICVR